MQMRSFSVSRIVSPMKKPLLRMLWWVSVAPFGMPVVPLVNWMLIGSSNCSRDASLASRAAAVVNVVEGKEIRIKTFADTDERGQRWKFPCLEIARRARVDLWRKLAQH